MKKTYIIIIACILLVGAALASAFFKGGKADPAPGYTPDPSGATTTPVVTKPNTTPYGVLAVSLGQTVNFADFSLKLTKVESDSRCPANANCVWAGTTTVRGEFVDKTGTTTKVIELGKTSTFGSITVALTEVAPHVILSHKITDSEYRFTLSVQKKSTATITGGCFIGGCSAQICSDQKDVASTCEYRPEYMCYKSEKCERQANGSCGWTQTSSLTMCLKDAASVNLQ
jgi:hypothetical protein